MAAVMGYGEWDGYRAALESHRNVVAGHFRDLIAAPDEADPVSAEQDEALWGEGLCEDSLAALGFQHPAETLAALQGLQQSPRVVTLQEQGLVRLQQFMPQLLRACADLSDPDLAVQRVLPLVAAVVRRSAYLVLLLENRPALAELVTLCAASPWICDQLTRNPALLDELSLIHISEPTRPY